MQRKLQDSLLKLQTIFHDAEGREDDRCANEPTNPPCTPIPQRSNQEAIAGSEARSVEKQRNDNGFKDEDEANYGGTNQERTEAGCA